MSKKAQGLSMTVIIVAAIALLVLVILSIIFIGRMGSTTDTIDSCKGTCIDAADDCKSLGNYYGEANGACKGADGEVDSTKKCCVGV